MSTRTEQELIEQRAYDDAHENCVPNDITLGELKESYSNIFETLLCDATVTIPIRYVDQHGKDYPDDMEIGDFLESGWNTGGRILVVLDRPLEA